MDTKTVSHNYLSDGEVHYLWHFMQGSIMDPYVRRHLRNSWGFCQRHTVAWLIVESTFHHNYLHGPSILLADLIERAQACFPRFKVPLITAMGLRNRKPCFMCFLGYTLNSKGSAGPEMLIRGRDVSWLLKFAGETEMYWRKFVCPQCTGTQNVGGMLCRTHLIQELFHNNDSSISDEEDFINYLSEQIRFFARSFRWECQGTETTECKASLITAAGWLNGWTELLNFIEKREK